MTKNKLLLAMIVACALVSACSEHEAEQSSQIMSDDFGVCVNLPEGATYRLMRRGVDFEVGRMSLAGSEVDVYVGYQPNFEGGREPRGDEVTSGFVVVGMERSAGVDRLLLGNKRLSNRGPLFVMFSAPELRSVDPVLTEENMIVDCE